jgi:hypothetical protein
LRRGIRKLRVVPEKWRDRVIETDGFFGNTDVLAKHTYCGYCAERVDSEIVDVWVRGRWTWLKSDDLGISSAERVWS